MSNSEPFQISVVIPAYNAGAFISRAIESVLAQTSRAAEIIVVDDGSTDDTAEQAQKYGDQVRYIYQENVGASAARNTGIKAARYEWIAFLDGDDEWLPQKLQHQIDLLQRNPELIWCAGNYIRCLCVENRRANDMKTNQCQKLLGRQDYFDNYFRAYIAGATGHTNTMIIKREALMDAGLFNEKQKRFNDMDMWFRIAYRQPRIGFVCEPLSIYYLDIRESISQMYWESSIYCDLIERHLKLAANFGRTESFTPCAAYLLRGWMRAMLFDARGKNIRGIMKQFNELLPGWFKAVMWCLTVFPRVSAAGCHTISWIVRRLRLRKKPVRKPS